MTVPVADEHIDVSLAATSSAARTAPETAYTEQQLQAMSDHDLAEAVVAVVFEELESMDRFSIGWSGLGLMVDHMVARGYTMLFEAFEASHREWMNSLPGHTKRGDHYQPAEVTVVDFHHRLPPPPDVNWRVRADTLPRAAAIAAVLVCQMERIGEALPPHPPGSPFRDNAAKIAEVAKLRRQGLRDKEIANRYGVTHAAIAQFRKRYGIRLDGMVRGGGAVD